MKQYDKYTFFYGGPFSQWCHSPFVIDGVSYNCAEQFMMHKKALAFDDLDIAVEIMQTDAPWIQKALGKKVKGFNKSVWESIARDIVFRGNCAKFSQNKDLCDELMRTHGTLLVEASPTDTIWGIGLDEIAAQKTTPADWKGTNWLGQICTEVREQFEFVQYNLALWE